MLIWALLWAVTFVVWGIFVGKIAADEALFAAIGTTITLLATGVIVRQRLSPPRAEWRAVAQAWRLPKYIVVGTWEIVAVLAKQIFLRKPAESLFHSVPFDTGGDDDESSFRRALAIAYTTATPNFVVIGIDREHRRLVYHQIQLSKIPEMTKRLGANP